MWATRNLFVQWAIVIASVCLTIVATQMLWLRPAEQSLQTFVSQIVTRDASQQVHIVEVDAASISDAQQWPWPREYHAQLIDQLDAAGARSIVFDIDFSSHSTPQSDAALADAIARSNAAVVMPTFTQQATSQSNRRLDALPIPALRENTSLASASVLPDRDALVRRMVFGTVTDGVARPSMSAQIAGSSGAAESSFLIDFSIVPASIPTHSFVDVQSGNFDPNELAGKDILVGATAVELGDRYGVPAYGVIPGVTIQALASETLIAGALYEIGWFPLLVVAVLISWLLVRLRSHAKVMAIMSGSIVVFMVVQAVGYHGARTVFAVVPAIAVLILTGSAQMLRIARVQLKEKTLRDGETQLPNAYAFAKSSLAGEQFVAVGYIHDFDAIQAVLGKQEIRKFFERVVERVEVKGQVSEIYRSDTRMIAWKHTGDYKALTDAFETLAEDFKKPLEVTGKRVDVGLSFGFASGSDLAAASRAASQAVKDGNLWHAHEDAEAAIVEARVSLMGELDEAIEADQLTVLYQPKLRLSSNRIESVEALVRWEHPVRGYLRPDLFIPLAEETNRIEALTLFVLSQTVRDVQIWVDSEIDISAAVNISANLISSERFVRKAEQILRDNAAIKERIVFEVTESATMRDPEVAAANLRRFRELGVLISMDDYGTGQSTLSYIQMLPLSEIKIDRAFVQNAHIKRGDALLVRSTIQLAHSLGLRVVGEGVEEEKCLDFLREAGCDYAQGYHVAKPMSLSDLTPMLAKQVSEKIHA